MSEEENSPTNSRDILASFADLYAEKPLIRALFTFVTKLIPGASAFTDTVQELIASGVDDIQRERLREWFDELANGDKYLTLELIQKSDFIHAFICTYRAAMRTRHKKKIRMFARLLLTGIRENQLEGEELEEFISILDDLSIRELELLIILKEYESQYPYHKNEQGEQENDLKRINQYWDQFVAEVGGRFDLTKDVLSAMLSRLTRAGLYQFATTGIIFGNSDNQGYTTELFALFCHWLESSED